jgi:hypothetical protein
MSSRYLSTTLRRSLETAIREAREVAQAGASDAIRRLGVSDAKAPNYLNAEEKELRRRLRAHARALGDAFTKASDHQDTKRLVEASAYAHWHRMLFARFLADRGLLHHPVHNAPVTLEDCRDLASEEGLADGWAVAERYAAAMLPGVFRIDDPVLALVLDPVHAQGLQRLVVDLDADIFQADDSLGWTYQFWRAAEKDAVNDSGVKIGADELPAVTQLFTEPYMVRFLLHNTLGAWWAGKRLAADTELAGTAPDEDALRAACALPDYSFDMLRFVKEEGVEGAPRPTRWRPAAGTFSGWPTEAKAITVLDPCCGSGHFLTEMLAIMAAMRKAEEGLSSANTVGAVLRDNLYGLEIDGRCVQIAAFAVALSAWRIGGWQSLPLPHIAWVGAPPPVTKNEFVALANGNADLERALGALHDLFRQGPLLGTLIQPTGGDLVDPRRVAHIERLLEPLIERTRVSEPEHTEGTIAARGMADATAILVRHYVLQATNVPFLGRGRQHADLAGHLARVYPDAKADLALAMLSRMERLAAQSGSLAAVSPQSWLYLTGCKELRETFLSTMLLNVIAALGPRAFETISGEVVNTALVVLTATRPRDTSTYAAFDANDSADPDRKRQTLLVGEALVLRQKDQLRNPDARIVVRGEPGGTLLSVYADAFQGITSGDNDRYRRNFWELPSVKSGWCLLHSTSKIHAPYAGRELIIWWGDDGSHIARAQGMSAWGKKGVAINQMSIVPATLYSGTHFDMNTTILVPKSEQYLPAIYTFCRSEEYVAAVRRINKSHVVTTATSVKVPFDLGDWQKRAAAEFPDGLPEPSSDDPMQWLFHGHPAKADVGTGLHVALARLLGFRWAAENDQRIILSTEAREWANKASKLTVADNDGLLSISAVTGERPLPDRLRSYLSPAFGSDWSDALERRLVNEADEYLDGKVAKSSSLESWLRDRAFRQHCALFNQRPFLWHIWDGLKDGFSVFVHYHRFDQALLRKLTFTALGDWLARATSEKNELRYEKARELQQVLEKILEGEKPYDIFVRWKLLAKLPIGWEPDLDDGVRMNIRPFIVAGILRDAPNIKWTKDRGNDVASAPWYPVFKGERINDHHTTLAEKRVARENARNRVVGAA